MNNRSLLKSRKFRFGAIATAFTALFIAIIIVFNGIFSVLADKFGWYADMTNEAVFTFSKHSLEYLGDITADVNIYFASDPDVLMADEDMRYVYNSAKDLETEFSNIHVECRNYVKNPDFFRKYQSTKGTTIDGRTVIIESGTESIVYNYRAFFTYNEEGKRWGYNGEYRYVAGIMQVTQAETPIAYFTTGHSEDVTKANALANLLYDCGFDVRQIDLKKEEISDDARIIVVFNPKYDFYGIGDGEEDADVKESTNEIKKLDEFLDGLGGLMVFEDPEYSAGLNNLNEFLEEWGIQYDSSVSVRDHEHAMTTNGYRIITEYEKDDTFGKDVYDDLENFDSMPHSVIENAMPIKTVWSSHGSMVGAKGIYTMIQSHKTAELVNRETEEVVESGEYNLVTISYENRVIDNDYYYSYVMAAGSPSFAYNNFLIDGSWGNSDVIFSTLKLIGRDRVLADLDTKPFDDTSMDVTTDQARKMTVGMTCIIPAIVAVAGAVVVIRRRHS